MTHKSSSTTFSSLNFPLSTTSDSSACSSPCSSPSPPSLPQDTVQSIVPFVWEKKPGVTKPINAIHGPCTSSTSSSALESNTNSSIVYDKSLQFAPLRPPPRLSDAFLSQSRVRESKLTSAQSFMIRRRRQQARPKKPKEEEDPFFLALKACTKVEGPCNAISKEERARLDGLQTAFRGLFKPEKRDQQIMGTRSAQKVADHHSGEKSLGQSHKRGKLSSSLRSAKEGGKASSNGSLHTLISANERGKATSNASLMPALISDHVKMVGKASSNGSFKRVGSRKSGKELGGSLQGSATRRDTELHGQSIDANTKGARKKRTIDPVQGIAKQRAQVVEFNACGYGGMRAKNDHHDSHLSSKHNIMLTDILGCRTIQPLNGTAIHLSLKP